MNPPAKIADHLNRTCSCVVTDVQRLHERIDRVTRSAQSIVETHPNLFSNIPVFLEERHLAEIRTSIRAIEKVVQSRSYQERVLSRAPAIATVTAPQSGVFFGYDFHIGEHGPRLIEINTNAGGAFLNIAARDHQIACCGAADENPTQLHGRRQLEDIVVAMFQREWELAGRGTPLRCIAIVDERPASQYLYPDFVLAKNLFESRGIRVHIADLSELKLEGGKVSVHGEAIDLIYNRSTDFYLESPDARVLRDAFEHQRAVVTPHPSAHALYANKQNLALLSNSEMLADFGLDPGTLEILARTIPATHKVEEGDDAWWADRKAWFFKPESGFGSRGSYRGDKLTRRAFADVVRGGYVAQEFSPPGERVQQTDSGERSLKVDIRCYVYEGEIQLMAARLYQGQTTNFRTTGGGFAPVYIVPAAN